MLKSGGAVIHMQQNFNGLNILFPKEQNIDEMKKLSAKSLFDTEICEFLNSLSEEIRHDAEAKKFPDIVTFGFFCRKAHIEKLRQEYMQEYRVGRGLSFHIAPSNVPINFAYSMIAGLLAGNSVVVRVSTKDFEQTKILCRLMNQVAVKTNSGVEKYIAVVSYSHDQRITDYISSLSDVRVIWGGDNTIEQIRESKIPARCVEITFADRYSICVLDAKEVLNVKAWKTIAQNFYNDTYLYDQNACSSPRLLYWLGSKADVDEAQQLFWNAIYENISPKYQIEPVIAVDKLTMDYRVAIELDDVTICKDNNLFHRIELKKLDDNVVKYSCPGGSFLEYRSDNLDDLTQIVNKKYQTMSYFGCDACELAKWVVEKGLEGIDRIVPIGKTADFTLTWDGYNLIEMMSRKIYFV